MDPFHPSLYRAQALSDLNRIHPGKLALSTDSTGRMATWRLVNVLNTVAGGDMETGYLVVLVSKSTVSSLQAGQCHESIVHFPTLFRTPRCWALLQEMCCSRVAPSVVTLNTGAAHTGSHSGGTFSGTTGTTGTLAHVAARFFFPDQDMAFCLYRLKNG